MHGRRRARPSLYREQLAEKQKLAAYYNLRDRQFTRQVEQAQAVPRSTTDALQQTPESRLPAPEEIHLPFEIDVAKIIVMYTR